MSTALQRGHDGAIFFVDPIGIQDDFFYLGGDSLLATQVISRANDLFGRKVTLGGLFETPTLRGLPRRLNKSKLKSKSKPNPKRIVQPRADRLLDRYLAHKLA